MLNDFSKILLQPNRFVVSAPTRIDLAGGTLDIWPLYLWLEKPTTISMAIDLRARIEFIRLDEHQPLRLVQTHSGEQISVSDSADQETSPAFGLFVNALRRLGRHPRGWEIRIESAVPPGSGLGGSSALLIAFLAGLQQNGFDLPAHLTETARDIEATALHTPTGMQDYWTAVRGGLLAMNWQIGKSSVRLLKRQTADQIQEHILLVYTGKAHISSDTNWMVFRKLCERQDTTTEAMANISRTANRLLAALTEERLDLVPELLHQELQWRRCLTPEIETPQIAELIRAGLKCGAQAAKICGAGGGGCLFFWIDPADRRRLQQAISKIPGCVILPFSCDHKGVVIDS